MRFTIPLQNFLRSEVARDSVLRYALRGPGGIAPGRFGPYGPEVLVKALNNAALERSTYASHLHPVGGSERVTIQ